MFNAVNEEKNRIGIQFLSLFSSEFLKQVSFLEMTLVVIELLCEPESPMVSQSFCKVLKFGICWVIHHEIISEKCMYNMVSPVFQTMNLRKLTRNGSLVSVG